MKANRQGAASRQAGKQPPGIPQPEQLDQDTWIGGGREPIHPDDIGEDGEYLGKDIQMQQRRSTDTSDD